MSVSSGVMLRDGCWVGIDPGASAGIAAIRIEAGVVTPLYGASVFGQPWTSRAARALDAIPLRPADITGVAIERPRGGKTFVVVPLALKAGILTGLVWDRWQQEPEYLLSGMWGSALGLPSLKVDGNEDEARLQQLLRLCPSVVSVLKDLPDTTAEARKRRVDVVEAFLIALALSAGAKAKEKAWTANPKKT